MPAPNGSAEAGAILRRVRTGPRREFINQVFDRYVRANDDRHGKALSDLHTAETVSEVFSTTARETTPSWGAALVGNARHQGRRCATHLPDVGNPAQLRRSAESRSR